ncbi:type IV secretory system conjugative DNA transfer family protein [Pseudoroseicyclus sp. CXY001]|uniref:type IV secretory system conjugative DNA transfer family protein n=1 Tax=Pseudoroseicyclus sp. CXY001 TaxID=3242492 RepID=UPI0035716348
MSLPFRKRRFASGRKPFVNEVDPVGKRLIGLVPQTGEPIFAPKGHSLLLSANGGGKTTAGSNVWLFSLLSSTSRSAILLTDSKDGELAAQSADMIADLGLPVAVIDDMGVFPADYRHRVSINPISAVVDTYLNAPDDLLYANELFTHSMIEEPQDDARNRYFRSWPRLLVEFVTLMLLKRNPKLATPGGVWQVLSDPMMLANFAEIEAAEGEGMLRVLARNILGMTRHEHWPQHCEAAENALRIFAIGTRLNKVGIGATTTHFELIQKRAVIFLVGPQAHMSRLGPYYALHLMGFINALYRKAGGLTLIGEEVTNAPLKPYVDALTTLRAFGGTEAHNIAQSRSEIEKKLGKHAVETIEENAIVKQWFGFSGFTEAKLVSDMMGEQHAVQQGLGADSESFRLQTNWSLIRQKWMSPAELMAMPAHQQLIHVKGVGFFVADKISQNNIAPYCDLVAANPLEGGRLPSDPKLRFPLPTEAES